MKVLHVITSMVTAGAEHLLVDLLPALRDQGNEVELALFDGTDFPFLREIKERGITVHSFGLNHNVYSPKNIIKLVPFMKRYDIVHTHNTAPQLFAAIAKVLSLSRVHLVTTEHNTHNRRRGKWYLRPVDQWMYRRYAEIICISDQAESNLVEHIGKDYNVCTIFNGVRTKKFISHVRALDIRKGVCITMIAAFRPQKDQDTLVRAIAALPDGYRLQLVGEGERRSEIEALVQTLGIGDRVNFMGIRSDIPDILRDSDIVVMSSHWEGLSLSNIEGMASGRPFVASDVDGLREVTDGYGLLFPHGDANALADVLRSLAEDKDLYRKTAERCQERALQFDISVMAAKYNELYKRVTGNLRNEA